MGVALAMGMAGVRVTPVYAFVVAQREGPCVINDSSDSKRAPPPLFSGTHNGTA